MMPFFNLIASAIPKLLNSLVDLDLILYGGDDIENGLNSILFNAVASTIPKWWTFNLTDCLIGGFGWNVVWR
jgi:hypothetical protein